MSRDLDESHFVTLTAADVAMLEMVATRGAQYLEVYDLDDVIAELGIEEDSSDE